MRLLWMFAVLFGLGLAQRQIEVEGKGVPGAGQAPVSARPLALNDALRNAVEQGVGVFINSSTVTKNFELIEDRILKKAGGFARLDRVIAEGPTSEGAYRVRAQVTVNGQAIASGLRSIIQNFNDPRVGVLVLESLNNNRLNTLTASTAVSKALSDLGYRVVDRQQIEQNLQRDQANAILENPRILAQLATRIKVDLLVVGVARASTLREVPEILVKNHLIPIQSDVELRLVDATSSQVIWTDQFEGYDYDLTLESAFNKSLKAAATEAAKSLALRLGEVIQGNLNQAALIYLIKVSGFRNFSSFNAFIQGLTVAEGMVNVQARDFDAGGTEIEVEYSGKTEGLALLVERLGVEVLGISGREIRARAK